MELDNQNCSDCGASEWNYVFDKDYPERRAERDRTIKTVYACKECGAEGKHFEHQDSGTEQLSGALR